MHHRTIQINHQPDATLFQFIILTFIYSSTCFGRSPAHHQELNDCSSSLWFYLRIVVTVVLCSWPRSPAHHQELNDCSSSLWFYLRIVVTDLLCSWPRSPAHHQELNDCSNSLWFYLCIVVTAVLCSWPRTQHDCHHDTKVKPEAATAVIDKRQDNKLEISCFWLVIYFNC